MSAMTILPAQSSTVKQFIHSLNMLPDHATQADVDHALLPALEYKNFLRASLDPRPYIGLVNVFDIPNYCRQPRLRAAHNDYKYIFPFPPGEALRMTGPAWVETLSAFTRNFDVFCHGVLKEFHDWDNVVVAGGSVLAALVHSGAVSKHELIRSFHSHPYEASDIDMFLWGLSPNEVENKVASIFKAVKDSVPWNVVAVRKANTISIHTQYPHRPIQIVLRLYQSPTEILIGFDVDSCSVCYDGKSVWATPRALASVVTRRLTIDMTRRSLSYEMRLAKYSRRGFEVYYPQLQRHNVNPDLYNEDLPSLPAGLARLLVLERMYTMPGYYNHLRIPGKLPKSISNGEFPLLKLGEGNNEELTNNYECTAFQIPYALSWDARCIKRLDTYIENWFAMHRIENNGYLHQHVMRAYKDVRDCFANVCQYCPEPRNEQDWQEQERNDKKYIRGPLSFIVQNPGQQLVSGSFNPTNNEEWEADAYSTF